ncbi:ABC transporter permease [Brachybacterium sp. AOP25-B2-12]|uniref:ABC transporter permease n=1 Tax=Brachybacterium sp. AOP25-B2-12 TaxID=3457710 RepID=UPI0040332B3A
MSLKPRAVLLVTSLELRQRVRSVRWFVALGVWFLVLLGMSILLFGAILAGSDGFGQALQLAGTVVFSGTVLLLILAMLLIIPALSAGAINGDRTSGTLATLQATLLSPLEIVLGKVLAGWVTGLAFLAVALPSVIPSALASGVGILTLIRVILAIAVLTLFLTAMGVGVSSLTQRTLGSVVLSYLIVFFVTIILPIVYACSLPVLSTRAEITTYSPDYVTDTSVQPCIAETEEREVMRTDLTLALLYVNPFVIIADTAPPVDLMRSDGTDVNVLTVVGSGMRYLAQPMHPALYNSCGPENPGYPTDLGSPSSRPVWPWGMAVYLIGAAGAVAIATFRLRTPMRRVGAGTRIA